jgi:hypothetical protein
MEVGFGLDWLVWIGVGWIGSFVLLAGFIGLNR